MNRETEIKLRPMERHLQTLIVVIIVGLLGWVGTTVQETQVAVAKLSVEIAFLKTQVQLPAKKLDEFDDRLSNIERELRDHRSIEDARGDDH